MYKHKAKHIMKKNRKVTANSVTVNFRNYGEITIPKGVLVTNETAMGIDENTILLTNLIGLIPTTIRWHDH